MSQRVLQGASCRSSAIGVLFVPLKGSSSSSGALLETLSSGERLDSQVSWGPWGAVLWASGGVWEVFGVLRSAGQRAG